MLFFTYIKNIRKTDPGIFRFACLIFILYGFQLILKIEVTPLGYFSLYSNVTPTQPAYNQILPAVNGKPLNIYTANGSGFLMMEILPTRYKILSESDHCNQMNFRLRRIGLGDNNDRDCHELKKFNKWFRVYAGRLGFELGDDYDLYEYGFLNGKMIRRDTVR